MTDSHGQRRPSLASSAQSASPEALWTPSATSTSPTTPILVEPSTHLSCRQYVKPAAYLASSHSMFHNLQDEEQNSLGQLWDIHADSGLSLMDSSQELGLVEEFRPLYHVDLQGLSHENANPSLTKSMFVTSDACVVTAPEDSFLGWHRPAIGPPAETIEPSLAFHTTLPSSPYFKLEPSTPLKGHIPSSGVLSSSPLSMISPRIVPSQHDVEEYKHFSLPLTPTENKRPRTGADRLHRRAYERKRLVGSSARPKTSPTKTGIDCALVIEQNEFACSYDDCMKRFKRQEHKKRHEKTVHEKHNHTIYKCWVPDCGTGFSRTDNLKSHLRNTHSKRPGVRGNRYVATLDKNSEFYAPEWVGQLDKNGFPVES